MIRLLAAAAVLATPLPMLLGLDRPQPEQHAPATIGTAEHPVMLGRMVVKATALERGS